MQNFTDILGDFVGWSIQGYVTVFGTFFWPIIFSSVVGYIYLKQQSVVTAAIAIIILFAAFGGTGVFTGLDIYVMLMQLIAILALSGLVLLFIMSRRR